MKLDVWQRGMDLFEYAFKLATLISDFKLRSQFTDAAQSVAANLVEGYGRRTKLISESNFENFDKLRYEVENKLLALISSLEAKRESYDWRVRLPNPNYP